MLKNAVGIIVSLLCVIDTHEIKEDDLSNQSKEEELVTSGANIGLFMDTRSQIDTVGGFERYNAVFSVDN